jgi:hypothetical protein
MRWFDGPLADDAIFFFVEAFWVVRVATFLQFLSGWVILIEVVGETKINEASKGFIEWLTERERKSGSSIHKLLSFPSKVKEALRARDSVRRQLARLGVVFFVMMCGVIIEMFVHFFPLKDDPSGREIADYVFSKALPVLASIIVATLAPPILRAILLFVAHGLTVAFANFALGILRRGRLSHILLIVSFFLFFLGFVLEMAVS